MRASEVGDLPERHEGPGDAERLGEAGQLVVLGSRTGQVQFPALLTQAARREGLQGDVGVLFAFESLGDEHDPVPPSRRAGRRRHTVEDHLRVPTGGVGDESADGDLGIDQAWDHRVDATGEPVVAAGLGEVQGRHDRRPHQWLRGHRNDVGGGHVGMDDVGPGSAQIRPQRSPHTGGWDEFDRRGAQSGAHGRRVATEHVDVVTPSGEFDRGGGHVAFDAGEVVGANEVADAHGGGCIHGADRPAAYNRRHSRWEERFRFDVHNRFRWSSCAHTRQA